jgi:AraC-like DNA-binding protein
MIKNHLLVPMTYIDKRLKDEQNLGTSAVNVLEKKLLSLDKKILTLTAELEKSKKHLKQVLKRESKIRQFKENNK